jgi:imidazolonepropionase-like amidohydrolase
MDSVSHAYMLAYEVNETRPDTYDPRKRVPVDLQRWQADTTVMPALFAEMRRRGVILDATVHTMFEADQQKKPGAQSRGPLGAQVAKAAYQAGVAISAGTDFVPPAADTYPGLQTEMETLVGEVGMSPADVIRAATDIAAQALRLQEQMGTLSAGKLANLVVVARNPLDDIKALREVVLTVKRGRAYPRAEYRQPDAKLLDEDF